MIIGPFYTYDLMHVTSENTSFCDICPSHTSHTSHTFHLLSVGMR